MTEEELKSFVNEQVEAHENFLNWMRDNHPGHAGEYHWKNVETFVRQTKNCISTLCDSPVEYEIELSKLNGDYIRQVWKQKCITELTIRTCGFCSYPVRFVSKFGELYIDTNCGCTNYETEPRRVGWDRLVDDVNKSASVDKQKDIAKRYGFVLL